MESERVLEALEHGLVHAGIFLSHPKADLLDQQGLIHDRHALARTDVLLAGPTEDIAGIRGETDGSRALMQVLAAVRAGAAGWLQPPANSALGALADGLSRGSASQVGSGSPASRMHPAYRLVTRAQWLKMPDARERLKVWPLKDPRLALKIEVACSFRARHEGARLLVSWLQWPLAQSAVKAAEPAWERL